MQSVIVGLTNLVMTLIGMALIDRLGRKALLLLGSVTFVISHWPHSHFRTVRIETPAFCATSR
jgi:MFS family permease